MNLNLDSVGDDYSDIVTDEQDPEKDEDEQDPEKDEDERQEDLLARAKDLYDIAMSGWGELHQKARSDIDFFNNKQWSEELIEIARLKGEPALTVNLLPNMVQQVENDFRSREMSITFAAMDALGSDDTANMLTSLTRNVEQCSDAKAHYMHAAGQNGAMVPGFGFLKVNLEYESDNPSNVNQVPRITSIADPLMVVCDPSFTHSTAKDAKYWFELADVTDSEFKQQWPGKSPSSFTGTEPDDFRIDPLKTFQVVRFHWKEETVTTYFLLKDEKGGVQTVAEDMVDSVIDDPDTVGKRYAVLKDGDKKPLLSRRIVNDCKIMWADLSGQDVLDEGQYVGKKFPYVLVPGVITRFDGKLDIRGMIRFARDPQQFLNFLASSTARRIASANKSPWLVDMAAIAPYKTTWDRANKRNAPYLPYLSRDQKGNQLPAPVRADQTAQIQDLIGAMSVFQEMVQRTIGIFDAGVGATANDQSGVAIQTLAQQGSMSNAHFSENFAASLKQVGEILVDLYPVVYDTPRAVRIVGADNKAKIIRVNEMFKEGRKTKQYTMNAGTYGVAVNVGPSNATAKQAAIEQLLELARCNPNLVPFIQDIIARNMDFDGKDELVVRLTKLLAQTAPQLVEDSGLEVPPEAQAAMAQLQAQNQQLNQELQQSTAALQQLTQEKMAKKWSTDGQLQVQAAKTQDTMTINAQENQADKEQEALRAQRDALDNEAKARLTQIDGILKHTEEMYKFVGNLVKHIGPDALKLLPNMPDMGATQGA